MTDHPVIFSAPMILALLQGRKTQTRRLAMWRTVRGRAFPSPWQAVKPGARLWVREAWCETEPGWATFRADHADGGEALKWRPAIHMPRWASRLTLTVTAVKVERLQAISEADAEAEGVDGIVIPTGHHHVDVVIGNKVVGGWHAPRRRDVYETLWEHLNGLGSWASNPEVVVLSFTVEKRNIDG